MKLFNSLGKTTEPIKDSPVRMYSCGPTVYDHVHIGNLSAFIYADTLRRALSTLGLEVKHVMNVTDIDDKTIAKSKLEQPDKEPMSALQSTTKKYTKLFIQDMELVGNDMQSVKLIKATDYIIEMQNIIKALYDKKIAYIANDGIYFSIEEFKKQGGTYGHLTEITSESTGAARVANDEYDKEQIHDFALWKREKPGEPSWEFGIDGTHINGRPGWHIECSAMSEHELGLPFTIHTGGIDLLFPHHENEIAQSTGASGEKKMASFFFHNEHMLVDGKKMSKSLGNFYRLLDITEKGFDPLAFRLMTLQSHYRSQTNFGWDSIEASQRRLLSLRSLAAARHQPQKDRKEHDKHTFDEFIEKLQHSIEEDLNLPELFATVSEIEKNIDNFWLHPNSIEGFTRILMFLDSLLGLKLLATTEDITPEQKMLIAEHDESRAKKDYENADTIRSKLANQGIGIRARNDGASTWHYV